MGAVRGGGVIKKSKKSNLSENQKGKGKLLPKMWFTFVPVPCRKKNKSALFLLEPSQRVAMQKRSTAYVFPDLRKM